MRVKLIIRFWYWVYRWSKRIHLYSEYKADSEKAKELMRQAWLDRGMNIDKDCICNTCICNQYNDEHCNYIWDLYNFGDGCLGEK